MTNKYRVPQDILDVTKRTIERYSLLDRSNLALVAFSGGKDSSITALALRELGYDVHLAVVGGIWKKYDILGVADIARDLDFRYELIDVSSEDFKRRLEGAKRKRLEKSLSELEVMGDVLESEGVMGNVSPCTGCYNNKATALEKTAELCGVDRIVFGHHQDDALASFIKSALMFDDYHIHGNHFYETHRFNDLVSRTISDLGDSQESLKILNRWGSYAHEGKASTDEPPRQLVSPKSNVQIVRPLFGVSEGDIIQARDTQRINVQGSGCAHGHQLTRTAREIIHQELIPKLNFDQRGDLADILSSTLNQDGSMSINARRERDSLLPGYKMGGCKL